MSREAFEAWISENDEYPHACRKDPDGRYAFPSVRNAYFIWQAATAAALEEAAQACESEAELWQEGVEARLCAARIRALKEEG